MKHNIVFCKSRKEGFILFLILSVFAVKGTGSEKIFCDPLTVRPLSGNRILLTGSCRSFYAQTFRKRHSERLKKLGSSVFTRQFVLDMEYRAAVMDLVREFRGRICETWRRESSYALYDSGGRKIPVKLAGFYWLPDGYLLDFLPMKVAQYHIVYHAILKTGKTLPVGSYSIHGPFGSRTFFRWDPSVYPSALLQVRDLPCSESASRFVNAAFWSGSEKVLDLSMYDGKDFEVVSSGTDHIVHKGRIHLHKKDPRSGRGNMPLRGSMMLTMDLSAVRKEGRYFVRVPSLGRSQDFRITSLAGEQQCRIYLSALKALRCRYCHKQTARGDFPGDALSYRKSPRSTVRGFFTPSGESFSTKISTFLYSREIKEFPLIPGLYGGWHEDPSGRKLPAHLGAVNALLAAVLYGPQNREVHSLLEEALYGLDLYRRTQRKDGSASLRVEPSPHRRGELLLAAPDRNSTLAYAQSAALAALVLKEKGQHAQSNVYLRSAMRAWEFASDRNNRLSGSYRSVRKNRVVVLKYYEDPELDPVRLLECAITLYHLSGEQRFLRLIQSELPRIRQALRDFPGKIPFRDLAVFFRRKSRETYLKELYTWLSGRLLESAERCLSSIPGVEDSPLQDLLMECSLLTGAWYVSGKDRYYRGAWQKALVFSGLNVAQRDLVLSGSVRGVPDRTQEITRVWGLYFPADLRRKKDSYSLSLLTGKNSLSRREHTRQVNQSVPACFRNISVTDYSVSRYGENSFISRLGTAAALFHLLQRERLDGKSLKK